MTQKRTFLLRVLEAGYDAGIISADDIMRHVTLSVMAHHLPVSAKARLLSVCLEAERMTTSLVVETVGFGQLCDHAPVNLLWECISDVVSRHLSQQGDRAAAARSGAQPPPRTASAPAPSIPARSAAPRAAAPRAAGLAPTPTPTPTRKPNVPAALGSSPGGRLHPRENTLERALDALEMDDDDPRFDDMTRPGDSKPPVPGFDKDSTDVYPTDELAAEREGARGDWSDEDTNPGVRG